MKRFKSAGQAQRFLSAYDGISNLFHLRRHQVPATQHRATRSQAFQAWAEVAGVAAAAQPRARRPHRAPSRPQSDKLAVPFGVSVGRLSHRAARLRLADACDPIGCSPNLMPVEALWRWLREDLPTPTAMPLLRTRRVAALEAQVNQDPCTVADRLRVKDRLDPEKEKLRFPSWTRFNPNDA